MSMELTGTVHHVFDTFQVTDSFKKREIVIEDSRNPEYPEFIKMEVIQDKVSLFDSLRIGQEVTVSFNLKGRSYTDKAGEVKYFNTVQIWKIDKGSGEQPTPQATAKKPKAEPEFSQADGDDDDLPF